jgi:hypothetical protein
MKFFKFFDTPKTNLNFIIEGEGNIKIVLGGIINILIIVTAVTIFQLFSSDMLNKTNPNIFIQSMIDQDNKTIKMNQSTINVIIQPYYSAGTESIFEIDYSLFTITGWNA